MIGCKVFILISLSKVVLLQLQRQTGCSNLRIAHEALCTNSFVGLASQSQQSKGPPGKRGPPGLKGENGLTGMAGQKGQPGVVDYNRVRKLTISQMKQDVRCSVGMKDRINTALTMSSSGALYDRSPPNSGRLDEQQTLNTSGAWCGRPGGQNWIQVRFKSSQLLGGVVTQGSPSSNKWVKTFSVACGNDEGDYTDYTENGVIKIFQANSDRNSKAFNIFPEAVSCRSIKIIPKTWKLTPCLRFEMLHNGCYAPLQYKFYVKSQGADDGWSCHISINGVVKAIRTRGFCVVIFNPKTATFQARTFDTYDGSIRIAEATRMIAFLSNAADYSVVAIAIKDAASPDTQDLAFEPRLAAKLRDIGALGVSCDLSAYGYRDSFALIGQKLPNGVDRPEWVRCQHVKRHNGYASVYATIKASKYFNQN